MFPDRIAKTARRKTAVITTSGINHGLVQAAKAKAREYRSFHNFASIIYLVAGKLDLSCQPTRNSEEPNLLYTCST